MCGRGTHSYLVPIREQEIEGPSTDAKSMECYTRVPSDLFIQSGSDPPTGQAVSWLMTEESRSASSLVSGKGYPARNIESIHVAHQRQFLWPTIADAVKTFVCRRGDAQAYEIVWRLVHVWEAIVITLGAAATARINHLGSHPEVLRRTRELLFGLSWSEVDDAVVPNGIGALDGSIERWIEVLWLVAEHDWESDESGFLRALKALLDKEAIDFEPFLRQWRLVCTVPDSCKGSSAAFRIKEAMRNVNTFRNRLAHVPFPFERVEALAVEFEKLTNQLFEVDPAPTQHDGGPLTGFLLDQNYLYAGSNVILRPNDLAGQSGEARGPLFGWPAYLGTKKRRHWTWPAEPFIHTSKRAQPWALTRLHDREHGAWEYTRFCAEADSVTIVDNEGHLAFFPVPRKEDYAPAPTAAEAPTDASAQPLPSDSADGPAGPATAGPAETLADALQAARSGDFDRALLFLRQQVEINPQYHTGWLRLGITRREQAVRLRRDGCDEEARALLRHAVSDLGEATKHTHHEARAKAYYERSKAYFRLHQLSHDQGDRAECHHDAVEACKLSPEEIFQSWLAYLERVLPLDGSQA